jgi:CHASE3 domain sensor protein
MIENLIFQIRDMADKIEADNRHRRKKQFATRITAIAAFILLLAACILAIG